ncbi:hypothetical protein [Mesobacterium pallidum]|uniref:hypothetical protein n=1 Tax=Mesobacterium pallidum TaxID=2872037 RepID=UPI001EE2DA75|nr:hypothetical protein [Mesobacterium pallidum]
MVTVISTAQHIARKSHRCDSCMREIEVGTVYRRARCVDGGEAWTWKTHLACQRAGEILWDHDIRGEEDCLINVIDMDHEDRGIVYSADPETFHQVWPGRPAPGHPTSIQ